VSRCLSVLPEGFGGREEWREEREEKAWGFCMVVKGEDFFFCSFSVNVVLV